MRQLCEESLRAAVRAQPEVLLVASSAGYRLVTTVLKDAQWAETRLTGRDGLQVPLARGILDGVTVLALGWQLFARFPPVNPSDVIEGAYGLGALVNRLPVRNLGSIPWRQVPDR